MRNTAEKTIMKQAIIFSYVKMLGWKIYDKMADYKFSGAQLFNFL